MAIRTTLLESTPRGWTRLAATISPALPLLFASALEAADLSAGDAAPAAVAGTNAPVQLPTVIVTAEKEPTPLQSLPASDTAVTRQTIQDADIRFVKEAEQYAPNVFVNEFSARKLSNPYFRGIGSSPNNPGVTTYIDGVPQLNANSSSIELIDVEQIEFIRGPQGALYGRNTIGGLINITSRRPSPVWTAQLVGEYGNYDYNDVRLILSGPIVKDLDMSVAAGYSSREGYTKNDYTGNDLDSRQAFFGKGQLLWSLPESWEVRFLMSGEAARDGDYALGDLAEIRARPHHVAHDFEGYTDRDIIAPTLLVTHNGPAVQFAMITGLVWWQTQDLTDLDTTTNSFATRNNLEKDFQFTEDLRFASTKDAPLDLSDALKLGWQGGLSFFTQNYDQNAVNHVNPPLSPIPGTLSTDSQAALDDIGLGAYAQLTLAAWEKLDFSAGIHGDYEYKKASLQTSYSPPIAPATTVNANENFCEASPQFSLAWHITPDQMAYATVGRGYKPGGFNPISPPNYVTYGSESTWNYEAGAKTTWLDNRLSVNFAAFYIQWNNIQLNQPLPAPGQFYIANAGAADSKGVELEVRARPLAGWDLFAAAGYTDAQFLSGSTAATATSLTPVNVSGNHLIFSPDFTASGGTQYSLPLCRQVTAYARAEVIAYGRYFYNPANTAWQDTYCIANFRAGLRGNHWFAEGWVKNAFDAQYVPIAFELPNGLSGFVGESGAPVTFGVRAGLSF